MLRLEARLTGQALIAAQRRQALKSMQILFARGLDDYAYWDYEKKGTRYVSARRKFAPKTGFSSDISCLMDPSERHLANVAAFERQTGNLVYHMALEGEPEKGSLYLFYTSPNQDEWLHEIKELRKERATVARMDLLKKTSPEHLAVTWSASMGGLLIGAKASGTTPLSPG